MKYLDKSFFKFTLGFLVIISISLLLMAAVSAYAASISKIAFTTEERSVKPNEISAAIIIQTQDSSGVSMQTPETLDLEFTSTSATGEFLNSTGNPTTKTMNKNTANRTFYYRDSKEGVFTINLKATGRDSGEVWNAEQKITVSSSATPTENDVDDPGEVLGDSTDASSSATSGSVAPTYATVSSQLEVSAGGNRLTAPGSPINFQAFIKKSNSSNGSLTFSWSFGDGNVGEGALVSHMYKYPGEYAVILNVRSGNIHATSRLKVAVIKPDIEVSDMGDHLTISNKSNSEINLFNWKIISGEKGFIFQPDTIILGKSEITLDKNMLTMKGETEKGVVLKNFFGEVVTSSESIMAKEDLERVALELQYLQSKAIGLLGTVAVANKTKAQPVEKSLVLDSEPIPTEEVVFESPKEEGFMQKLKNFFAAVFD